MHWLLFLALIVIAALIFYQDITTRSVLWFLFPATAIVGISNSYIQTNAWTHIISNSVINIVFLLLQFILLKLFYVVKKKNQHGIINKMMGVGDTLFLLACCFFFSPLNFLLFYCGSLLFALVIHLLFTKLFSEKKYRPTVPLAGWQAVFLLLFICTSLVINHSITTDDRILKYLLLT